MNADFHGSCRGKTRLPPAPTVALLVPGNSVWKGPPLPPATGMDREDSLLVKLISG